MKAMRVLVGVGLSGLVVPVVVMAGPPMQGVRRTSEAGPLWNDAQAQSKCPSVCGGFEAWTRGWWTTVPNRMAVCECIVPNPAMVPVQVASPPAPVPLNKRPVEAGPIWSNDDARAKCPRVCQSPEAWNGQWWTTVQGVMSVCECVSSAAQPPNNPPPGYAPPQPQYAPAPPPQTAPQPMNDATFAVFLKHLKDAAFKDAQLAAVGDEVRAGSLWSTRQLIAVMQLLTFGDVQTKAATQMWPNIVDPQNLPDVLASLPFESDRRKLRQAVGR